jgi:VanZ like protein
MSLRGAADIGTMHCGLWRHSILARVRRARKADRRDPKVFGSVRFHYIQIARAGEPPGGGQLEVKTIPKVLTIVVAAYWLALFVGTHIPRIPTALQMPGADKWQHTAAYAGLAFLLAARSAFGRPVTWKWALAVAGGVILFGAFDELTQIPVGRNAEFYDWIADGLGTAIGIGLFAVWRRFFRRPE